METNKLSDYNAYFRSIATSNKLLQDFTVGNAEEIISRSRSDLKYPCLWLETPSLVFADNGSSQITGQRVGAFTVLKNAPGSSAAEVELISEECETIMLQILGKLQKDRKAGVFNFSLNGCNADAITPLFVDADYGWRVEFRIEKNICVGYHPEDWNP